MKIALFVDFDNVYSGLRRISAEAAERFSRQPLRWLSWLTTGADGENIDDTSRDRRRVLVRRCYLNPVMYQKYRRPFHEAGFEIVDCPPMTATGKTSTDIHLVLDTMDALLDDTHFDEFVVFSADADFSPVLRRLRRHDRRTVVFAAGAMSESYKASADRVIDIQTFLHDALELPSAEDEEELPMHIAPPVDAAATADLRRRLADQVRSIVLKAELPVRLPALAQSLQRENAGLREGLWDGAGSFGNLMRQLGIPEIQFDFPNAVAIDLQRMGEWRAADATRQTNPLPPASAIEETAQIEAEAPSQQLPPTELKGAAEEIVKRSVAESKTPVHLAVLGQVLRRRLPQLATGWAGAPTLAAFLQQLNIEPLQRALLDNGTTAVLYDPARHEPPAGVVGDRLVIGMLRAAELPEMRGADLVRILENSRQHMGTAESFEIAKVSRSVAISMTGDGFSISPRRVATVLQAMIFGGLDATKAYAQAQDLIVASMGVILSAWARETQVQPDDEARGRLLAWLGPTSEILIPE
ncbi:NYN domain-containing protein [Variovorax paradoxus]|uniref:NYN domain-containing protein n=1 Tax=Variovorax paradoxus TaxID=34073 RepID=UPI003ED0C4A4